MTTKSPQTVGDRDLPAGEPLPQTEDEWRVRLSPERYAVLRQSATEPPWSSPFNHDKTPGVFRCAACSAPLFDSEAKYESGSGWPSFFQPRATDAVRLIEDASHGMIRTEVVCARCGSHLGHLFDDGPRPTGQRYCMNGLSLEHTPE